MTLLPHGEEVEKLRASAARYVRFVSFGMFISMGTRPSNKSLVCTVRICHLTAELRPPKYMLWCKVSVTLGTHGPKRLQMSEVFAAVEFFRVTRSRCSNPAPWKDDV